MMKAFYLVLLAAGLCASAQGSGLVSDVEAEAKKEFLELKEMVLDVGRELKDVIHEVRTGLHAKVQEGLLHIDSTVDDALVLVAKVPEQCRTGVVHHLTSLKKASFWEFLKCSKLVKILEEGGSMVYDVVKTVGNLLVSVDRLVNLPTQCATWNVWKMFKCYLNAIKTVKDEVFGDIQAVKDFIKEVKATSQEIKANIHECLYPGNTTSTIQADVARVMARVQDCVHTGNPVKLH